MKTSEVFAEAARRIEVGPSVIRHRYACWVVGQVALGEPWSDEWPAFGSNGRWLRAARRPRFARILTLLRPDKTGRFEAWYPSDGTPHQDERILMLCMAAAIAADEEEGRE
jgi:hypothetical protein